MDRYLDSIEKEVKGKIFERAEIIICPPSIYIDKVARRKISGVKIGAQNIFWERKGAFMGEISADMFKSTGASYVVVGHSERRKYFGEDEEIINLKMKAILKSGLSAILCVGESIEERKAGHTAKVVKKQILESFGGIGEGRLDFISVVYEPIWAVGSDNVPTSDEILEAKLIIKKALAEIYSIKSADKMRILYGGSISTRFVHQVCIDPAMDGGLVGRESLNPHEFIKIAEIIDGS
jgi:triosephosphate isomerase